MFRFRITKFLWNQWCALHVVHLCCSRRRWWNYSRPNGKSRFRKGISTGLFERKKRLPLAPDRTASLRPRNTSPSLLMTNHHRARIGSAVPLLSTPTAIFVLRYVFSPAPLSDLLLCSLEHVGLKNPRKHGSSPAFLMNETRCVGLQLAGVHLSCHAWRHWWWWSSYARCHRDRNGVFTVFPPWLGTSRRPAGVA